MKKKRIIIGLSVVVLAVLCVVAGINIYRQLQQEKTLKEKNSKASIVEVFHDQANEYITPDEPTEKQEITLRLRTERYNVTKAQIQYTDDKGQTWKTQDMSFEKHDDTGYYDYFVGTLPAQDDTFYYRFLCGNELGNVYVDRRLIPEMIESGTYEDCWSVIPGYSTPEWSKGALWYNINPDAFYNGDASNDVTFSDANYANSWNNVRSHLRDKYGGDLEGIEAKAEHIKDLYVDAVFINPFNKNYQNGGYNPVYFNQVEPSLGNAQELQEMIETFHEKGLKVGSDAVLTFATNDSIYFDQEGRYPLDGADESEDSVYKDLFVYYNWPENWHQTWGQPAVDHNKQSVQELLYSTKESFMQYYTSAPFSLDSWRFDCGGWLYGITEEGYTGNTEIISEISDYMKEINPEVLLLSENLSEYDDLMSGEWDSHWNIYFMKMMQNYVAGLTNEDGLSVMLNNTLNALPRSMALSTYNLVVNHDEPRTGEVQPYMETAQILTMMTYIGSPSIYYGEEINLLTEKQTGMGSTISFYAMDWDESNWDYYKYNLYKSLGELRNEYSALKTGAIRELVVDNENNIYAFGRWDDDGTVITIASQNKEVVSQNINVRKLGVSDGTIFTDWLTGKQYTVDENGMLQVDVIPGGSILVKGKKASQCRQEFVLNTLKHADADIYLVDTDSYLLDGTGKLGSSDKLTLASANLYGAGSIYAKAIGDGKAVLTVRQSNDKNAPAYFVIVSSDKLEVKVRTTQGGKLETVCKANYTTGNAVKIERDGQNRFSVFVAEMSDSGKIASEWTEIKNSAVSISMEHIAVAGFAPMSGEVTLSNVTMESVEEENNFDDFENDVIGSLLTSNDSEQVTLEGGKLVLNAKEGITWATTESKEDDWTFKAKLDSRLQEGTYAGVMCKSDEKQWITAGRTTIDGEPVLFVGHTTDGTMMVDSWVKDTQPDSSVVVQLQRIGTMYSAVYSYDETSYHIIDESVFMNLSSENVGIFVAGDAQAAFDYVSFGDSIHDGVSINTPYSDGVIDVTYTTTTRSKILENTVIVSGEWEYGEEGYYQTKTKGISQLGVENKAYDDFRVNATLQHEEGNGYVAIGFGKQEYDSELKEGYLLQYERNGKLTLLKNGKTMAEVTVKTKQKQEALRIVLEVKDSAITVYAGQNSARVLHLDNTGYSEGYVCFYTVDTAGRFMNSRISSMDTKWSLLTGINDPQNSVTGGSNYITCVGSTADSVDIYGSTSLIGVGVTDFVTTFKVSLGEALSKDGSSPEAGVLLCASEGDSKAKHGINVALIQGGTLVMRSDGKDVAQYELGEDVNQTELMIVKKNRVCQVYVRGIAEAVLEYEDTYNRGGAYQLYVVNAEADFANIGLEDIHTVASQDSELYQLWTAGMLTHIKADVYRENFEEVSAWNSLYKYYTDHGTWEIEDGVLSCVDSPQWASGITIYDRVFNEFEMEFKYRFNEASLAWAGVLLHKQTLNDHNVNTDFSILFGSSGDVMLFDASKQEIIMQGKINNFKVGDWYQLKIVCQGGTLKVYQDNKCLIQYKDSKFGAAEGFLSFTSNGSMISFDDVLIQPLGGGKQ